MYSCLYLYPGLVAEYFFHGERWLFHYITSITSIVDGRTFIRDFTDRGRNQKLKIERMQKKVTRTENS